MSFKGKISYIITFLIFFAPTQSLAQQSITNGRVLVSQYEGRTKTILEQVLNYTTTGEMNGVPRDSVGGSSFWVSGMNGGHKCILAEIFGGSPGLPLHISRTIDIRDFNQTTFRISQGRVGDDRMSIDTWAFPRPSVDRLVNAWGLAFQECPGRRSAFERSASCAEAEVCGGGVSNVSNLNGKPNFSKYESYKLAHERMKTATEQGFPLEAVAIAESLMCDRFVAYARANGNMVQPNKATLGRIASWVQTHCAEQGDQIGSELAKRALEWTRARNLVLHEIAKSAAGESPPITAADFVNHARRVAVEGRLLVNKVQNWNAKLKRAALRAQKQQSASQLTSTR